MQTQAGELWVFVIPRARVEWENACWCPYPWTLDTRTVLWIQCNEAGIFFAEYSLTELSYRIIFSCNFFSCNIIADCSYIKLWECWLLKVEISTVLVCILIYFWGYKFYLLITRRITPRRKLREESSGKQIFSKKTLIPNTRIK